MDVAAILKGWFHNPNIQGQTVLSLNALGAVQIAQVALFLEDQHQAGALAGQVGIVQGLAYPLGPFVGKIKFNGVGICKAVAAGAVAKNEFF